MDVYNDIDSLPGLLLQGKHKRSVAQEDFDTAVVAKKRKACY